MSLGGGAGGQRGGGTAACRGTWGQERMGDNTQQDTRSLSRVTWCGPRRSECSASPCTAPVLRMYHVTRCITQCSHQCSRCPASPVAPPVVTPRALGVPCHPVRHPVQPPVLRVSCITPCSPWCSKCPMSPSAAPSALGIMRHPMQPPVLQVSRVTHHCPRCPGMWDTCGQFQVPLLFAEPAAVCPAAVTVSIVPPGSPRAAGGARTSFVPGAVVGSCCCPGGVALSPGSVSFPGSEAPSPGPAAPSLGLITHR